MNHPVLSRYSSLTSSQEYETKTNNESQDRKSTLTGSIYNYCPQLHKSAASYNNSKLYSSAATCISNSISQEIIFDEKHSCLLHKRPFTYSCITCIQNVCSECLLDPTQHRGHRFQRYNERKEDLRQEVKKLSAQINFKRDGFNKFISLAQKEKLEKPSQQNCKLQKLENHSKREAESLTELLSRAENECSDYKTILKQFHQFYSLNLIELMNTNKVSLVLKTGPRIQEAMQMKIKEVQESKIEISRPNLNHLRPNFYSSIFTMCNFTKVKETTKEKIFQPFEAFQSLWRLKVYPSGYSGVKTDEKHAGIDYMSVYAERLDGLLDSSKYVIQIETTSRVDPRLKIRKQFKSEFTKNESWGYDRYTRLSNIYDHGFLGDDDTLFIKISIAPISYYEANRALAKISEQKQRIQEENERKIKILTVMLEKRRQSQISTANKRVNEMIEPIQQKKKKIQQPVLAENQNQPHESLADDNKDKGRGESSLLGKHLSMRVKQQVKEKISERAGALGISRNRTHYPSISLQKKSPAKLIRLISLKNVELIESSKRKIHNRSSTYY